MYIYYYVYTSLPPPPTHPYQDVQANEASVAEVNVLARKLLAEGHPDSELIRSRQEALNESWADLRTLANHREERLAGAHEIQRFNRCALYNIIIYLQRLDVSSYLLLIKLRCQFMQRQDILCAHFLLSQCTCKYVFIQRLQVYNYVKKFLAAHSLPPSSSSRDANETKSWMNEKDTALLSDDYGRDLASVQALQRKHEGLERDLAALEDKVGTLGEEARRLQARHADSADQIAAKQAEIVGLWEGIKRKASQRGARLEDAQHYQKFLGDHRSVYSGLCVCVCVCVGLHWL